MKTYKGLINALLVFLVTLIIFFISLYRYELSPTSKDNTIIEVKIDKGMTTKNIAKELKKQDLIRNKTFFYLYVKLKNINIKASTYELSKNQGMKEIVETLHKGSNYNPNSIRITFQEGLNMRQIAKIIEKNTNNSYNIVLEKASDKEFLNKVIKKYWFITEDILNEEIYYKLEGYLHPNTYEFSGKDVTVEEIFTKMLDEENKILDVYKEELYKKDYNIHEILTIASMCELEGSEKYRKDIAGVFYNRLDMNMNLGSDVTTYYGAKIEMHERDLTTGEINTTNAYNTRSNKMAGKLPVSPICNPSKSSIEAAIKPNNNKYYYFVADKNGKVYFSKTGTEHFQTINEIKSKGDWIEW